MTEYNPNYKIKTREQAEKFLKEANYIHTTYFDSMKEDEQMPNLRMSWHLELEHWVDINTNQLGKWDHLLIVKSKPIKKYPKVDQTDMSCLPGDDEEKRMDFDEFLPGKRIDTSWFLYCDYPNYLERCTFEFVGYKNFDSSTLNHKISQDDLLKLERDHKEVHRYESEQSDQWKKEKEKQNEHG